MKLDPLHASAQFGLARAYQQSGQADPAHEAMKKFQYITQNKLGAPISLSYGEQGKYSRAEDSPLAVEKVPAQIPVKFVDVTKSAGIISNHRLSHRNDFRSYFGPGACFLDYDNDGRIDVLLADNGPEGGLASVPQLRDGKFEDVTKKAGLDPTMHALGCTTGDYDNDGFTDLALTVNGRVMLLLHNEKNGTFKDVTESAGIKERWIRTAGLTFVDYDHDGDLDLYVTGQRTAAGRFLERTSHRTAASLMWRNNGNGTFTDVTDTIGSQRRHNRPSPPLALTTIMTER